MLTNLTKHNDNVCIESSQQIQNHFLKKYFNHSSVPVDQIQNKGQHDQNIQITKVLKNGLEIG